MDLSLLIREYQGVRAALLAFASRIFPSKDAAWREDLVDEVIQRRLAKLSSGGPSMTREPPGRDEWRVLYRSLYHLGVDWRRREKALYRLGTQQAGSCEVPADCSLDGRDLWESYLATPTLTGTDREILKLHFEEGRDSREIGVLLGRTPTSVRKALSRAYEKIHYHHFRRGPDDS